MIRLNGVVTNVERVNVEVSEEQIRAGAIVSFSPLELVRMSLQGWLALRLLNTDVKLSEKPSGGYCFRQFEDNGSHYSGYFEVPGAYREGDEIIWNKFHELMDSLK